MSRSNAQRGPLLSSLLMVLLATVATGLLVVTGFQGLPDAIVASGRRQADHVPRNVDVTNAPTGTPRKPAATPTAAPTSGTPVSGPYRPGYTSGTRSGTGTVTTAPAAPKTTSPTPTKTATATPSPTKASSSPSPSPSCTTSNGRKPKCPKSPGPHVDPRAPAPTSYSPSGTADVVETSRKSVTDAERTKKAKKTKATKATKAKAKKVHPKRSARR